MGARIVNITPTIMQNCNFSFFTQHQTKHKSYQCTRKKIKNYRSLEKRKHTQLIVQDRPNLFGFLRMSQIMHGSCSGNINMCVISLIITIVSKKKNETNMNDYVVSCWCEGKSSKETEQSTKERDTYCNEHSESCMVQIRQMNEVAKMKVRCV